MPIAFCIDVPRGVVEPVRAAVAVGEPVTFGLMRMFQIHSEKSPIEIEIFHDLDAARGWIEGMVLRASQAGRR